MAYSKSESEMFESQGLCGECGGDGCSYCEGTGSSSSSSGRGWEDFEDEYEYQEKYGDEDENEGR